MKKCMIRIFDSNSDLYSYAAELFCSEANNAINRHGKFTVALSGGSTPGPLYELLATEGFKSRLDWTRVDFFWSDERCVPKDHPDSNFKLAYELLLSKIPVPNAHIHRILGELDPEAASIYYRKELSNIFPGYGLPVFDLILLGMGTDGHTASIFPESASGEYDDRSAISVFVNKLNSYRITLTLPVLNNAATVAFLVSGSSKARMLRDIFEGFCRDCPAAKVAPKTGRLIWLLDNEAASLLETKLNP